ncbi:metallo-beta-lactamase domain protein [Aspergillus sclerotialis]|uniref:Metallo-beta-lactamase domain protein n=1 Tax=Aspergillus sclerotialis TaxID=2070753 RepID=A0A3A2ZXL2_9EURO|nr:metallo-beta-lactamase domain protein [Aspergillus sclerotialis]
MSIPSQTNKLKQVANGLRRQCTTASTSASDFQASRRVFLPSSRIHTLHTTQIRRRAFRNKKHDLESSRPFRAMTLVDQPTRPYTTARGTYIKENIYTIPSSKNDEPTITAVFENNTGTWQYIVSDPATSSAVIIDAVLDYDRTTQDVSTHSADELLALVNECGLKVDMILETHIHADHLSAASYLQKRLGKVPIGIGGRIERMQRMFGQRYGISENEYKGVFGKLFKDDEVFRIGELSAQAVHLPGHTPDHLGYMVGENIFCGDSVFHIDIGTARCDFPGGSATDLFNSTRKLLSLSDSTKIWTGHDYPPPGRGAPVPWLSVAEHRKQNKHLMGNVSAEEFVRVRQERDKQLAEPKLLHQSLQMNIRGGRLPPPTGESGGKEYRFLKVPLKVKGDLW